MVSPSSADPRAPGSEQPAFGEADLTNCEREQIHLAGSIQPHGVLLLLSGPELRLEAASANAALLLGPTPMEAIGLPLARLVPTLAAVVQGLVEQLAAQQGAQQGAPQPLHPNVHPPVHAPTSAAGPSPAQPPAQSATAPVPDDLMPLQAAAADGRLWEGAVHAAQPGRWVLELEPLQPMPAMPEAAAPVVAHERDRLLGLVSQAVERMGEAASLGVLADTAARCVRDIIGYDRVMIYKFDADGHGEIIAEARDPRLESLLGHHYPATDIPQRARQLYMRNRVRVLVDVHYAPAPLIGRGGAPVGDGLDMSMCYLRSMSPLHLQYLKNMGVTATLVVSLVHDGQLWGLISAHHYSPRNVRQALRATCDLLAEVVSTRIAAIENYAHAQVAVLVRRLEQRLIEATSVEGDWRLALFRNPRTLLQPLEATGAALFAEDEVLTAGEVPSTPELRELQRWVQAQAEGDQPFSTSAIAKANPALASLTPTASGVLAVRLSASRADMLMWFRKEQLRTVTWAGDPHKPMLGDDPLTLSPRRSFAAWSELVRGTALPWTGADLALARAFGLALVDIIVQVHAVRLLVAEHQLSAIRTTVRHAAEPVLIANPEGRLLFCNEACRALMDGDCGHGGSADASGAPPAGSVEAAAGADLQTLARRFDPPGRLQEVLHALSAGQAHWRGELALRAAAGDGPSLPVSVRAEVVPGRDGQPLGFVLTLFDLRDNQRAARARAHLEDSLQRAMQHALQPGAFGAGAAAPRGLDPLLGAILTNASLAAMDIADGASSTPVAPILEELENSTRRATTLYGRIRGLASPEDGPPST